MVGKVRIVHAGGYDPNAPRGRAVQCTQMLFGGNYWPIEQFIADHPDEFPNAGVLLSYYYILKPGGPERKRYRSVVKKAQ